MSKDKRQIPLTDEEKGFCYYMARLQNPEEAAARAGISARSIPELFDRAAVRRRIDVWQRRMFGKDVEIIALAGLFRIAFGGAEDSVALALCCDGGDGGGQNAAHALNGDYYSIGGIKRQKGGMEIAFAERIKALELLLRWNRERGGGESKPLLAILEKSVAALDASGGKLEQ